MEAVQFDLGFLIGKIVSLIENEASALLGVSNELGEIKRELVSMKSFLVDSETKRGLSEGEKAWVTDVRDIAHQVEDIIEEHMYHMNKLQVQGGKFTRHLYGTIRFPQKLLVKHQIATTLRKINNQIKFTSERRQRYGVDHLEGRSLRDNHEQVIIEHVHNRRESSIFLKEEDLVGIEDDRHLLVGWLTSGEPERTLISVVGMGGSGKTTLVAKVYDSQIVKKQYECYAWITVSQNYVLEDIIRRMIKEFYSSAEEEIPADFSTMSSRELKEMLMSFLSPKRYVLVLDDVWTNMLWTELEVLLPDARRGSRVMLTTRIKNVASSSVGVKSYVHSLKPLGETAAWALFCKKAFASHPNRSCPHELKEIAHSLVSKCQGLPLAIVALGGVLSSKKMESEWQKVHNSLNMELSDEPILVVVKTILLLGFSDLRYSLKRSFLYCCLFPEDFQFRRRELVRLWMAEGFVEEVNGLTPEEVGKSYVMELIGRSMLQGERRNTGDLKFYCKMHDLMREVALSTAAIEKFCSMYDMRDESHVQNGTRFLSFKIHGKSFEPWKGILQLRSLLIFPAGNISPSVKILPSGFRLLRVLNLKSVPIVKLPDELVEFFNLTYLNLSYTEVKELPKSIGRLRNLQTLDIEGTKIRVLPSGLTKLQNLRHLSAEQVNTSGNDFFICDAVRAPSTICNLKNLQWLSCVEGEAKLLKDLKNMTQLKALGICKVRKTNENELCISIQSMNLLGKLFVQTIDEEEYLPIDAISLPPSNLKVLVLVGKLGRVPRWFELLLHLTTLEFWSCRMMDDPLPYIQLLPTLKRLYLDDAYVGGDVLHFCVGFPKLRRLHIIKSVQLKGIIIERGVMPKVEFLILRRCMGLKRVPKGIEYLTHLKLLELFSVSNELVDTIRGNESVDRPRVRHIPEINHFYKIPSGRYYESLS